MRKYKDNIHLSKTETNVLIDALEDYINNNIENNESNIVSNLIVINALERLYIKLNEKHDKDYGYGWIDYKYCFKQRKIELIRSNRDKLLEANSKHIIKDNYQNIHHFNSYEKLKVQLPLKKPYEL